MGSKHFNNDLAASKTIDINGVSKVRRGDSDGEVVFTWSPGDATTSLDIRILVLDVDSYPKSSSVMIFTESDHSTVNVASLLERLSASLAKKSIQAIIKAVAEKLLAKVESGADLSRNADSDSTPDSDADDALESEFGDEDDNDDDYYEDVNNNGGDGLSDASFLRIVSKRHPGSYPPSTSRNLKKELRIVQAAGISVGVIPRKPLQEAEFFSLSLRVAKLGIPEHALEAWGLNKDEYVVLLCRFPRDYPSMMELLDAPSRELEPEFRFGKCSKPKPSLESVRIAFATVPEESSGTQEASGTDRSGSRDAADGAFALLYMSNSINMLMKGEFLTLLRLRRSYGLSWDAALHQLGEIKRRVSPHTYDSDDRTPDPPAFENALPSLRHDYALDKGEEFSLPMVAMQFALRRLVRCTKYCMVCYQKIPDEFDALKPYVCSNPLCMYQFISLGLGASIEHEVIYNPYVVDILISFFAASLAHPSSVRQYPLGLNLKSVNTGSKLEPAEHIVAEACFSYKSIRIGPGEGGKQPSLQVGDTILVVIDGEEHIPSASIVNGSLERHVCKVTEVVANIYAFDVVATFTSPLNVLSLPEDEYPTQLSNTTKQWVPVWIFEYKHDVDTLPEAERSTALNMILRGIPSVLHMRAYLLNNPTQGFAAWGRIDKNSLILLQWIISSNRSLILQDDAVPHVIPKTHLPDEPPDEAAEPAPPNPNKVQGLPPQWMQFRFLQGTPEREGLFMKELMAVSESETDQAKFPTIFAWHGSPLCNWHSIIRTGLDFNNVQHGRSYGNGVYMSNDFGTSLGYSSNSRRTTAVENYWPNSQLRPYSAISICEVVNRTEKFIGIKPHYVVDKIEWIQCRYLFVAVDPSTKAMAQSFPAKPRDGRAGYIVQCPMKELFAARNQVQIPLSALPSNRRCLGQSYGISNEPEYPEPPASQGSPTESPDSDHGETDHELLLDSDDDDDFNDNGDFNEDDFDDNDFDDNDYEDNDDDDDDGTDGGIVRSNKRRSSSVESSDMRMPKLSPAAHSKKMSTSSEDEAVVRFKTDFVPGALDLQSLPKLPEPGWATTSPIALKSLNRAIKDMHQIQSSEDMASLGWYIDFENLTNVFHWIVELHSFDFELPLAQDMKKRGCTSVVLEFRFGTNFPFSPPFVRVVRPRFLPFARGGGGHVTAGGAICSEMLTNSGWSAAMTLEKVLLQIRLGLTEMDPPARLDETRGGSRHTKTSDYGIGEAVDAYQRAARAHGWAIPEDLRDVGTSWVTKE